MKSRWGFLKEIKISFATQWRRGLCRGEAYLRSGIEIYVAAYSKVGKDLRYSVECHTAAYQKV